MILDVTPIQPDAARIYELINVWDHRCKTPGECPHPDGAVTRFAVRLGRGRSSFYNLRSGKRLGRGFAAQIATALHVEISDIELKPESETPRPQAEAKAA